MPQVDGVGCEGVGSAICSVGKNEGPWENASLASQRTCRTTEVTL